MELVSIIIPIHNAEQTIDRCLNSIVRQTYENLEIILVENGSADNSWAECMKWKEKDSRIICLQSPKGVSYARNSGLNAFRGGGYILFVDCDDWIEENTVQTMLDAARSKAVDIVQCARSVDKEDGSSYLDVICETELTDQEEILNAFLCFQKEYKWSVWGKLFSKSTVTDMLFNLDLIVGEDAEFNYRIIKSGVIKRFVSINECFYHYCMNVNSVQHASINEQKLVSYAMWKNIFVENPNNEYALWDYTWVGYDFIKSIIASDKCRNYFAPLRKDIKVNIHRIQGSNVFSKKFKLELWLIARLPVAYIAIRKIYSLRGR